jgi:hypothetical protein
MPYVHSIGIPSGTTLDFTLHTKWMIQGFPRVVSQDPQATEEFVGSASGTGVYLVDWEEQGDVLVLPVTLIGDYATVRASEDEILAMRLTVINRASDPSLVQVEYTEQLGNELAPRVWEVARMHWKRDYELVNGGNGLTGQITLRASQV